MSEQQTQQHRPSESSKHVDSAVIIFTAPLVKQLSSPEVRLPPNYVGVRRVRPSSRGVAAKLLEGKSSAVTTSKITFKIKDENGKERRMTGQEKKALKQTIALEKKAQGKKKRGLAEASSDVSLFDPSTPNNESGNNHRSYHQLPVNPAALEQELAELRGERGNLPPVILSPPMALQAQGVLPGVYQNNSDKGCLLMYDDILSQKWAKALKDSMVPAENVRQQEDMRPMAYQLTPEPWHRLRPDWDGTKLETSIRTSSFESCFKSQEKPSSVSIEDKCEWAVVNCRPPSNFDVDVSIVFEYLYRETSFYASCGAKFGSDFLIYDGPREERHAFAGMRVLSSKDGLPLPTAYSLAGYVRCLNKAGKLALLATVILDQSDEKPLYRIALVDVALEKILTAPTHQKRARTQVRRDVAQNLAKK
jgi:tRNA splicing endonuclease